METLIGILIYLAIVIICYYINKYIVVKYNKDNTWEWEDVRVNLFFSFFTPLSIVIWIMLLIHKCPALPEKPPKWL
jgi:hypothetical protein